MSQTASEERGARVSFPPPLVFIGGILLGVALSYLVAPARVPVDPTFRLLGGVGLLALGVGLILSARIWFVRTGQSPVPWKPSPELILRGPYRFTRNPMYLGMTLIVMGIGVVANNLWISLGAIPALAIVHVIAVLPEERYLTEKFGEGYTRYLKQVRRYL